MKLFSLNKKITLNPKENMPVHHWYGGILYKDISLCTKKTLINPSEFLNIIYDVTIT